MMLASGTLEIFDLRNTAENGSMPKEQLVRRQCDEPIYYTNRTVTYERFYAAKGADQHIDKLVRIWSMPIEIGCYVVLDGVEQYRVDVVSPHADSDGLAVVDLTLRKLEKNYDVLTEKS